MLLNHDPADSIALPGVIAPLRQHPSNCLSSELELTALRSLSSAEPHGCAGLDDDLWPQQPSSGVLGEAPTELEALIHHLAIRARRHGLSDMVASAWSVSTPWKRCRTSPAIRRVDTARAAAIHCLLIAVTAQE
jgi:hypothetical protein